MVLLDLYFVKFFSLFLLIFMILLILFLTVRSGIIIVIFDNDATAGL